MGSHLDVTLLLLAAAVLAVTLFRSLQLPPILGYLLVGIILGPHALDLSHEASSTEHLAEFGVVFLMFSIGLEFSLAKLNSIRHLVFGLGLSQVGISILVTIGFALSANFVLPEKWQLSWQAALALGGTLAMSSTAIVSKLMSERLEVDSPHGRRVFGILLFQDLAVVPLLILIPALANPTGSLITNLFWASVKAVAVLLLLFVFGKKLLGAWLHLVAKRRSHELFILNILLLTLGLGWITKQAGLSAELGAFVAGMLIAETDYKHQVEEDIRPFRDVLLGLFFVTIGMKLNLSIVWQYWWIVILAFVIPILFKALMIAGLTRLFNSAPGTSIRTGLYLAQAGEFGFVLLQLTSNQTLGNTHMLPPVLLQIILASMVLSMLAAPFLIQYSDKIALKLSKQEWLRRSLELHKVYAKSLTTEKHVIICGYGRCGQNLARFLEQENIPYIALDLDPERVREATAAGENVVYGDGSRLEMLKAAGLTRASAVVITHAETANAFKTLHHVRQLNPNIPTVVRTYDDTDLEKLQAAGAAEVVPEIIEGSLMLASHALVLLGVPLNRVLRRVQTARDERYSMLRGYFSGLDVTDNIEHGNIQLHSVHIHANAVAVGATIAHLDLAEIGVEVVALRRKDIRATEIASDTLIESNDVLVLRGQLDAVLKAEERLLQPSKVHYSEEAS